MGEYAEERLALLYPEAFGHRPWKRYSAPRLTVPSTVNQTVTWTMQDGSTIACEEMTPRHRGNVIRMLARKSGTPNLVESYPLVKRLRELGIE
jgi:hypothetical protein